MSTCPVKMSMLYVQLLTPSNHDVSLTGLFTPHIFLIFFPIRWTFRYVLHSTQWELFVFAPVTLLKKNLFWLTLSFVLAQANVAILLFTTEVY